MMEFAIYFKTLLLKYLRRTKYLEQWSPEPEKCSPSSEAILNS